MRREWAQSEQGKGEGSEWRLYGKDAVVQKGGAAPVLMR